MIIVGIHNTGILSSAAVVVDGELKFGCAEERLDRGFPKSRSGLFVE